MKKDLFLPKENGERKIIAVFVDGEKQSSDVYTVYKHKIKFKSLPKKKKNIVVLFELNGVPKVYYDIKL